MSNLVKSVTLRATVKTDASGLRDGLQQIKSLRRQIEANPIKIGFKIDASGIRAEAVKAAGLFQKEVTQAMGAVRAGGAGTTSKGGIFIPAGAMSEMKSFAATGKGAFKEVRAENGKLIQSFEQVAEGIQRVTSVTKKGKNVKLLDTRPLEAFQQQIAQIERKFAGQLGAAKGGKGDVASILRAKQQEITAVLNDPDLTEAIRNTPVWNRADRSLDRLEERIQTTSGSQTARTDRQKRAARIEDLKKSLLSIDQMTTGGIGTARATGKGLAQELADKRAMIQTQLNAFADIADSGAYRQAQKAMNTLAGGGVQARTSESIRDQKAAERERKNLEKAQRADFDRRRRSFIDRTDDAVNRNLLKQSKTVESIAKRETNQFTREQAINQVMAERTAMLNKHIALYDRLAGAAKNRGNVESASAYQNAARRLRGQANQIPLDMTRSETDRVNQLSNHALKTNYNRILSEYRYRMDELKAMESQARQLTSRGQRSSALTQIGTQRAVLQRNTLGRVAEVWREADRRGDTGLKDQSARSISDIERKGAGHMRSLANATTRSGHAFDFHTSSLLRNAATFTKWYIPAQLAMGAFAAIGKGISGAVESQRTFKILEAIYRGTAEESKLLADQTLILAAANGRSVDEAAQAAVAWSRMGLTRQQILVGMEASLRAANVAEISAAEATAYLTANYKAFGQTIADIPATLDYINALSNKNAVAPKEIFEGLSRSAVIAKEAGITFQELATIIATVSAETQRPGAEIGNAVKSLSTRLRRPATTKKLKEEFGYDVTTASGDAKKMTTVLGELAAIYPTLNRMEKGRLEDMVAGAHQGNRFASIMNNWTEILGAQADAGLESNSAMKENAKILDSVASKLEQLNTSWVRLFHTLGEAGLFQAASDGLAGIGVVVDNVASGIGKIRGWQNTQSDNPLISILREKTKREGSFAGTMLKYGSLPGYLMSTGRDANAQSGKNFDRAGAQRQAEEITAGRNRVESLFAMSSYFTALSKSFGGKEMNPGKQIEGFDKRILALTTAQGVPEGAAIAKQARDIVRPYLASGDTEQARKGLAGLAEAIAAVAEAQRQSTSGRSAAYAADTANQLTEAQNRLQELQGQLAATTDAGTQKKLQTDISKTSDEVKQLTDNLGKMNEELKGRDRNTFTDDMKARVDDFATELKSVSKIYGDLLSQFGGTGFSGLDATLAAGGAALERNMLRQAIEASRAKSAELDATDEITLSRLRKGPSSVVAPDITRITDEQDRRSQAISAMQGALEKLNEPTDAMLREIEAKRQADLLKTAYGDSRRSTGSAFGSFEIGKSEGDRLGNRGRGILRQLQRDVADPNLGAGDATRDARELGAITERMVQAKDNLFSLEDRLNRAVAERANLELQITEENRKQNEEASKRLATASREDQLRAAASQAYLRSRGKDRYSMDEFQFFSGETRNAIGNLTPRSVKGLDDSEQDQQRRRDDLNQEIQGIAISLRGLREAFNEVLPKAETKAGGIIDTEKPFGEKAPTADRVTNLDANAIRVNLNTGPINVQLDFSRHVGDMLRILQGKMDSQFGQFAREIRTQIGLNRDPDMSAVNGAL